MTLIYEGTDMTPYAEIAECTYTDSAGRCDTLHIALENAEKWDRWKPMVDDKLEMIHGSINSGTMYVQNIVPADGTFVLECASLPSSAKRKAWASYENMTMAAIAARCAGECGMAWMLYGVDGRYRYPYMIRGNTGPIGFLQELAEREGALVKSCNGKVSVISIAEAAKRDPVCRLELSAGQSGITHEKKDGDAWRQLTVVSGLVQATATDPERENGKSMRVNAPAGDTAIAGRWARNLLNAHNRNLETLSMQCALDERMRALACVEVSGGTEMDGSWIVVNAEHDLKDEKSFVKLMRG